MRVVSKSRSTPKTITLVDDVIIRSSSFVGLIPHLQDAFPGIGIRCFALVRTISAGDIDQIPRPS